MCFMSYYYIGDIIPGSDTDGQPFNGLTALEYNWNYEGKQFMVPWGAYR